MRLKHFKLIHEIYSLNNTTRLSGEIFSKDFNWHIWHAGFQLNHYNISGDVNQA